MALGDPKQVPDFIALRGDPSDKLHGGVGLGQNSLVSWFGGLGRFGSLNTVLEAGIFGAEAKMLRLSRPIARWMRRDRCLAGRLGVRLGLGIEPRADLTSRSVGMLGLGSSAHVFMSAMALLVGLDPAETTTG
jgi:hypothetical protein